ncbi:MAG: type III-A CRISPR-associated RAMP protein Csm5 [Rhodospirillales bacterium]|nr:type III-A CRISPR-associated RAMP protein Csm5 [Rhodospirillales bacterium]
MAPQILTLRAIPLTPIHVGDGTELTPDTYKIAGKELLLFDPARVLASLAPPQRALYLQTLDRGDLEKAQQILGNAATEPYITGRVAVSDASASALRRGAGDGARTGRVHPFVRSGGKPYIPGSSIKGALRTALLDHFSKSDPQVKPRVGAASSMSAKHAALTKAAFDLTRDDTADDPLRFLSVADVEIPANATRIDRAIVIKRARDGSLQRNEMQMHYERLLAASDGTVPRERELTVTITLDEVAMRDRRRASCPPGRTFDLKTLHDAAAVFHWGRWQAERTRFFATESETCAAMDRLLRQVKIGTGGKTLAETGPQPAPNYWLLRIGRFGHFESKSVDGLRQGHRPQDKDRPQLSPGTEGISRTVVRTGSGSPECLIPFGWLLLFRQASP